MDQAFPRYSFIVNMMLMALVSTNAFYVPL